MHEMVGLSTGDNLHELLKSLETICMNLFSISYQDNLFKPLEIICMKC